MKLLETAPARNRLAIACSIALHLCVLAVALRLPRPVAPPASVLSSLPVTVSITHRPRPIALAPPAPIAARLPAAAPAPVPHARPQPAAFDTNHPARVASVPVHVMALRHELSRKVAMPAQPVAHLVVAAALAPVAAAPVTAAVEHPASVATTGPAAPAPGNGAAARAGGGGDPGLFSATYPPVPQETRAFEAIRATLPARVRLRITIDENGRAAVVDWLTPPPDAALAGAVRARLMALPYIPAECDGLPCTGIISLAT